jgi:zona occludens toxin
VQERYLSELGQGGARIRLGGLLQTAKRVQGIVEWVEGNTHVRERMTLDSLRDLGVAVIVREASVILALGKWTAIATPWPMEAEGKVSEARLERMKPSEAPSATPEPQGAVSIGGTVVAKTEPLGDVSKPVPRSRSVAK